MAKKWRDVIAGEEYKKYKPHQRTELRQEYFENVVLPTVPEGEGDAAKKEFFGFTQSLEPNAFGATPKVPATKPEPDVPLSEKGEAEVRTLAHIPDNDRERYINDNLLKGNPQEIEPTLKRLSQEGYLTPQQAEEKRKLLLNIPSDTARQKVLDPKATGEMEETHTAPEWLALGAALGAIGPAFHGTKAALRAAKPVEKFLPASTRAGSEVYKKFIPQTIDIGGKRLAGWTPKTLGREMASTFTGGATEIPSLAMGAGKLIGGIGKTAYKAGKGAVNVGREVKGALSRAKTPEFIENLDDIAPKQYNMQMVGDINDYMQAGKKRTSITMGGKVHDVPDPDVAQVISTMAKDDAAFAKMYKTTRQQLGRWWVDASGNIKGQLNKAGSYGKRARQELEGIMGANAKSKKIITQANKDIYAGLNGKSQKMLDMMIRLERTGTIEGYKEGIKHGGFTARQAKKTLEWIKQTSPEEYAKLKTQSDKYFEVMRNNLRRLKDEGLITDESFENLIEFNYSPRKWLEHFDPKVSNINWKGNAKQTHRSGLPALKEGSEGAMFNDSRLLMADVISRTEAQIARNQANRALYNLAKTKPKNGVVELFKKKAFATEELKGTQKALDKLLANKRISQFEYDQLLKEAKESGFYRDFPNPPTGKHLVEYIEDGQSKGMLLDKEMAGEWLAQEPQITQQFGKWAEMLSGTKMLKAFATGYNPEFAVTNLARDMAHALVTSGQYGKVPIWGELKLLGDMGATFKDAISKGKLYDSFIANKGGREYMSQMGRISETGKLAQFIRKHPSLNNIKEVLGWVGETSEIWTRLAVMRRAMRNGANQKEAANIAANLIDFSQGGTMAKAVDKFVPYFNAGIQGTRTLAKALGKKGTTQIRTKGGKLVDRGTRSMAWARIASLGSISFALKYWSELKHPKTMGQTSPQQRSSNFIIPLGMSYKDRNGVEKHMHLDIAKDKGQRAFTSIFENMAKVAAGGEFDWDEVQEELWVGASDWFPLSFDSMPPTIKAIAGYALNKDFYRREAIVKGRKIESEFETSPDTPEIYKKFGELTGASPDRSKYFAEQFITSNNLFNDMFGAFGSTLTGDMPDFAKAETGKELVTKLPFLRRAFKATSPYKEYYDVMGNAMVRANTEQELRSREINGLLKQYDDLPRREVRGKLNEYLQQLPREFRSSARRKIRNHRRARNMEHGYYIRTLQNPQLSPEARARTVHKLLRRMPIGERETFERNSRRMPGFRSSRYRNYRRKLDNGEIENE